MAMFDWMGNETSNSWKLLKAIEMSFCFFSARIS